jgi:ABC-2 type transport system permease protein
MALETATKTETISASAEAWRSFKMATWLGWQIESNWADPFLFAIYSFAKPLASAAILVVMYGVITGGAYSDPLFPYVYLGNTFYIYVGAVMTGVSWAVIADREEYKTLKYIYTAPVDIPIYLMGRGVARFFTGSFAVIITLLAGVFFLHLPIDPAEVEWGLFFVSLFVGIVMLAMMGLLIGSLSLILVHHAGFLGEAVAGALYVFSGAIFPLSVLPPAMQFIGYLIPITYWLELLRRSLVGGVAEAFPTLQGFENAELLGILLGLSLVFGVLSIFVFRACNRRAIERGLIDRTTNY